MTTDAQWNLDLVDALKFEALFSAGASAPPCLADQEFIRPTYAESERAVANIRAWRSYLSEECVSSMIGDGWQWST